MPKKLVPCIMECLWDIDLIHSQIKHAIVDKKCKGLPALFGKIYYSQYRDLVVEKIRKPSPSKKFGKSANEIFAILSVWGCMNRPSEKFFHACKKLANSLRLYANCIAKSTEDIG